MSEHGLSKTYCAGCRCVPCREAHRLYEADRRKGKRSGEHRIVGATRARNHLRLLAVSGVGKRSASAASDLAYRTIDLIRSGKQKRITRRVENKILSLTQDAVLDRALVSRAPIDRMISELLQDGFTKAGLARKLGYKTNKLQFHSRVQARTQMKVEKFYNRVMAEAA